MVLHRRRSKLSNVLCFLNTPNLLLPCSAQDAIGWWMFLCLIGTQHKSSKRASLLCPGKVPMDAYSPGLNCREPDSGTVNIGWVQLTANHGPESAHCKSAEETGAKQTPGHERAWALHPSRALLYPEAQPLRRTVLFTDHRHTQSSMPFCLPPE